MHLLMCAPMLLVVGYLVLTGRAGGDSIFYALGCMAMMGVMMAMMNHGSDGQGSGKHSPGHRTDQGEVAPDQRRRGSPVGGTTGWTSPRSCETRRT
jgi:hypothetical protein